MRLFELLHRDSRLALLAGMALCAASPSSSLAQGTPPQPAEKAAAEKAEPKLQQPQQPGQPDSFRITTPGDSSPSTPVPAGQPDATKATPTKRVFRLVAPPATFSPPILQIDQADFDWGNALQGELVKHSFVLSNKGGAPLNVLQVKPSCGCTTAAKPEKPIEPGQSDVVTLEIDTKKFSGTIKKTADITTNASATPARVSIGGKVEPFFTVEPTSPRIDVVRGSPVLPLKVTLRRSAKAEFKLKEVKTEGKILTATLVDDTPPDVHEVAVVANLGDNPGKYFSEQLHVKLDAAGKEFDIPILVSVSVKERIDVQPRTSVYFSRNETKALKDTPGSPPVAKTLDIKSMGGEGHSFKITNVKAETQSFETKLEPVVEGKQYRLTISMSKLPADAKSRTVRDTLTLETDDPTVKELKITALAALQ